MARTTATEVAHAIIAYSHGVGTPVTNLKLQKLLYYAQAWYVVFNEEPLFNDPIEAWVHGPVVARVFGEFKSYRWNPILFEGSRSTLEDVNEHIDEVWKAYGKFDANALEQLTHEETPWKRARGPLPPDASSRNVIHVGWMREFYSTLLHG